MTDASLKPPPRPFSLLQLLVLSWWVGLVYGLLEGVVLLSFFELTYHPMWKNGVSPPILWVAPLMNGALFLAGGLVLGGFLRVLKILHKPIGYAVAVSMVSAVALFGLSMSPRTLNPWGCALLGAGAGVRMFRVARNGTVSPLFFRRSLGWLAILIVLVAVGTTGWAYWREQSFLNSLPSPKPGQPNVLLIILDTVRADHLSAYGYPRLTTPNLDRIAAEGVLFEHAYSTHTWTRPSHLSILSGGVAVRDRLRDPDGSENPMVMLSEALAAQGYATLAASANNMWCTPKDPLNRGFARFQVYFHSVADAFARTYYGKAMSTAFRSVYYYDIPGRKLASRVNQELLDWANHTKSTGRPFFAMLNYFDAHQPYAPPPPFDRKFSDQVTRQNMKALLSSSGIHKALTPAERQQIIDAYDSSLSYLDHQIGELRRQLERQGLFDRTLVIITADHGEALGENDYYDHIANLRPEVVRVPLLLRYPSVVPAGQRVITPVSLRRIAGTVSHLLHLGESSPYPDDSLLDRGKDALAPVMVQAGDRCALIFDQWHLVFGRDSALEVYDLHDRPAQTLDLAKEPRQQGIVASVLQRAAHVLRSDPHAPCSLPEQDFDGLKEPPR